MVWVGGGFSPEESVGELKFPIPKLISLQIRRKEREVEGGKGKKYVGKQTHLTTCTHACEVDLDTHY